MAEAITDWSSTAASNTDVDGINIAENCPAANINDAIRAVMASVAYAIRSDGELAKGDLSNVTDAAWYAAQPAGSVICTAFTSSASEYSTTANTLQDALTLAYAAKRADSKIRVHIAGDQKLDYDYGSGTGDAALEADVYITDGTTPTHVLRNQLGCTRDSNGRAYMRVGFSEFAEFTPGGTGSVTYKIQHKSNTSGHESALNRCKIIIEEIRG